MRNFLVILLIAGCGKVSTTKQFSCSGTFVSRAMGYTQTAYSDGSYLLEASVNSSKASRTVGSASTVITVQDTDGTTWEFQSTGDLQAQVTNVGATATLDCK